VTKKSIVRTIAAELDMTQIQARRLMQKTLDAIISMLVKEGRIELRNFGVFKVRWRKARRARNPLTGERVTVPERCTVVFKPGLLLEQRVEEECRSHESSG
jgi:nucleoid DNA-binding protein